MREKKDYVERNFKKKKKNNRGDIEIAFRFIPISRTVVET